MKNKASLFVKNIMSLLTSVVKDKITGVKSKAQAIRVRLMVFSLLKSKKLSLVSFTNKIHALLDRKHDNNEELTDDSKAIILYNAGLAYEGNNTESYYMEEEDEDGKYPDLTHTLFEEEEGMEGIAGDEGGSIIDMVKNSKENEGEQFRLEDEIDHVADLYIKRFRRQMRLQKLESFKRLQEMIVSNA